MVPHSWIFFSRKTLVLRLFCAFILCQRERKRHWVVRRARPCVLRFHVVNYFILGGRRPWVSKHHSDCVRGEICFKEIMSNTRLDLNHSSFTYLICEFLIIYRFLHIYILLLIITSICVIACIYIYMLLFVFFFFLLVNHKSKLLKYIQQS